MSNLIADMLTACAEQADWSKNSIYQWESYPTVAKSKYKETCVTFNACVLQRIGVLPEGRYIWHNPRGFVTGTGASTVDLTVMYPNKILGNLKSKLMPGDIIMDGNKADTDTGSHIFIISGRWDGIYPFVWDNHSAQQQLGEYKYTRNRNVFAVVRLDATLFEPRLTDDGIMNNPYWYSLNPFYLNGYGLANCTCYAFGRFWEISDTNHDYSNYPTLSTGDAEDWWNYNDGYERGQEPQLGAVICFADGPYSGDGHVAIVEEIYEDGSIKTSNSAYGGRYFYTEVLYPSNNYIPEQGYVFQGFIYNPFAGTTPTPIPPEPSMSQKPWLWKRELYNREEFLLR